MQLVPATISIYRTAENCMQDICAQTMKNKLILIALTKSNSIDIPGLNAHWLHFQFHVVSKNQISFKHPEKRNIEITQLTNLQ